jgi:hypothetical protein
LNLSAARFVGLPEGGLISTVDYYREQRARDLSLAAQASLPAVRLRHESSAQVWQDLAERLTATETRRTTNAPSKLANA